MIIQVEGSKKPMGNNSKTSLMRTWPIWYQVNYIAFKTINEVLFRNAPLTQSLEYYLSRNAILSRRIRSRATAITHNFFRKLGKIDWTLKFSTGQDIAEFSDLQFQQLLRIGIYELLFSTALPSSTIIDSCVYICRFINRSDWEKLISDILKKVNDSVKSQSICYLSKESEPIGYIVVEYSYPRWIAEKLVKWYGDEEAMKLCEAMDRQCENGTLAILANSLKGVTEDEFKQHLEEEGIKLSESKYKPGEVFLINKLPVNKHSLHDLDVYKDGSFQIQNESAILVSYLVDPQPGETIVDLCSAPGGKTIHMAMLMKNLGSIFAVDISSTRLKMLQENCERLGVDKIVTKIEADGSSLSLGLLRVREPVDRVLVDVPCSCSGIFGRRAELRYRLEPRDVESLKRTQKKLLNNASRLVKVGGRLVYSTCALGYEENDEVIYDFLNTLHNFDIDTDAALHGKIPEELVEVNGFVRMLPHKHKSLDGGFAVALTRKS